MEKRLVWLMACALVWACAGAAFGQQPQAIRFKTASCVDTQGIGLEVFHMLIPADWQFNGGIQWVMDNPALPAVVAFKVTNPTRTAELEGFPNRMFFWTNNQGLLQMFPQGSRYFGAEVCPTMGAADYLQRILIPRNRQGVNNLRVVSVTPMPELAQGLTGQIGPGVSISSDAAKAKIEYQMGEVWVEEEIYTLVCATTFQMQTMYGTVANVNWGPDFQFSFKAVKGQMAAHSKIFQTMVKSFRVNIQWFNKYSQVVETLIQCQIQQIHTIGKISEIIARTHDEISAMITDSYERRQAVYDKINKDFSQYIRGVDEYYDPVKQRPVELPSGYRQAWTNAFGEYIVSDSPSYNPNPGSNVTWHQLTLRR
ncbi:MAG: hypothetical protein AB1696_00305 [Planctomycetota bacterium]